MEAGLTVVNAWNEWDPLEEVVVGKHKLFPELTAGTCQGAASLEMDPVLTNLLGTSYAALAKKGFSDCRLNWFLC